jgi:hypothetical protein
MKLVKNTIYTKIAKHRKRLVKYILILKSIDLDKDESKLQYTLKVRNWSKNHKQSK